MCVFLVYLVTVFLCMSSVLLLNVSLDFPTCFLMCDQSSVYTALWPLSPTHLLSLDFCFVFPFSRFYGMFAFLHLFLSSHHTVLV